MKNLPLKLLFLLSISILIFGCKKDKTSPKTAFDIYIDFWNPMGTNPEIKFDESKTSSEIKIDFDKQFEGVAVNAEDAQVIINNFRIIDNNYKNYSITKITPYELNDLNEWREQVEFTVAHQRTKSLSVVLVLDRSNSLGEDFEKVKQYAVAFVNKLFEETNDNVRVGIVDFATEVNSFDISNNKTQIINYISALEMGQYTTFYEAVDKAIDMLLLEVNAESKALLGFTDGVDNSNNATITSTYLHDKLANDESETKISSFMLGFEGEDSVDKNVLNNLSVNGGISQFPTDANQLQISFDNFSKAIANVYSLTYTRRQSVIPETSPAKLKFSIQTE